MRKAFSVVLAAVLVLSLTACGAAIGEKMTLGTGDPNGMYYSYGEVLKQNLSNGGISVTTQSTEGSKANLLGIHSGEFQLGLAQSDVLSYAWQGRRAFDKEGRIGTFRAVAGLYPEPVQLITKDPAIRKLENLRGRAVAVGCPDSGVLFTVEDVLGAASMTLNDIEPRYLSFGDSAEALANGEVEAVFLVAGVPTPVVTELFRNIDVYLVPLDVVTVDRLVRSSSFYTKYSIPANSYANQEDPVETVAVKAVLIASDTASEDTIYELTQTLFARQKAIAEAHGMGAELTLENATTNLTVPFHPGAEKYYQEHGIHMK